MKIDVREIMSGIYLVVLEGDVDMSTSPQVRKSLASVFQKGNAQVIVDLSGVPYMDSSGIATLIEGLQLSQKLGIRFTLAGMTQAVEAAFDLAHLKGVFELTPHVESALGGSEET
jgi:anti-sigma B factor antagonist